jgi:hypothetical protein
LLLLTWRNIIKPISLVLVLVVVAVVVLGTIDKGVAIIEAGIEAGRFVFFCFLLKKNVFM